jgi:Mce-associated membrane protein
VLLSYSAETLDADLARAKQQVAAPLAQRFDHLAESSIAPSTRQQDITTKAAVVRAGVVDAQPERVVVLMFVDQSTTRASQPQPVQQTSQTIVTMIRTHVGWLISDMSPI